MVNVFFFSVAKSEQDDLLPIEDNGPKYNSNLSLSKFSGYP